jgi:predicted O-methyltransferase YrrM
MPRISRWILTASCLWLLTLTACQIQNSEDPAFAGLTDSQTLPILKRFPDQYRILNVPPADGRFLYDLVLERQYKRGLEIGTANGYSALWLGMAFRQTGGKLITIEINPEIAREAQQNFRNAGLTGVVDARINDAFREIPALPGAFDFVFIDAWRQDYQKFFDLLFPRVSPGGAITAHNVIDSAEDINDFLSAVQSNPALVTTIHRSSTRGISVSIKKSL